MTRTCSITGGGCIRYRAGGGGGGGGWRGGRTGNDPNFVTGMNVLMGVNNNAGVNGLAFVGIVDIEDASYRTAYDFKRHTALLNSDLGQCGLSAILFQYHDWTDPPHPDRSRRDSLIRMCTDR